MPKIRTTLATWLLIVLLGSTAQAGDVNIQVHVNAPPVPIIVPEPPLFLLPPALGFRVAVDVPYDLVFIDGRYFLCHEDQWYVGPHYNGPWKQIGHKHLPPGLRKFRVVKIREHRDEEYRHYRKDKEHYGGKHYRPEREGDHDDRDHDHRDKKKGKKKEKHDD